MAHETGVRLAEIEVDVTLTLEGSPLLATAAVLKVRAVPVERGVDVASVIRRAQEISTVANSVRRGFAVTTLNDDVPQRRA